MTGLSGNHIFVLGILIHSRVANNRAELIHFAFDKSMQDAGNDILFRMITEITGIYKRIKGIEEIYITYLNKKIKII